MASTRGLLLACSADTSRAEDPEGRPLLPGTQPPQPSLHWQLLLPGPVFSTPVLLPPSVQRQRQGGGGGRGNPGESNRRIFVTLCWAMV